MIYNLINQIKVFIINLNKKIYFDGSAKILGLLPHFKIPENGIINFGKNVVLNSDFKNTNTSLTYRCKFVTGYNGAISIGENTMLNGACIVSYSRVSIGKNCQVASSTLISDTDFHPVDSQERLNQVTGLPFSFSSVGNGVIDIGDNVWVGWGVTILKNVKIGENTIVAAGSVVLAGDYPANCLVAGNPAKVVKTYMNKNI